MRTPITAPIAAAAVAAAVLPLALAAPAHAERYGIDDPRDTHHGSDLHSATVRHGAASLDVTTQHVNLRRSPATGSGAMVFVDTDRADAGPEYVLAGGFYRGTDYVLRETDGFARKTWGDPVEHGDYVMRVDYAQDTVRFRIHRPGIGDPDDARVAVRVAGTRNDGSSHGLVDWLGEPRSFTPWIAHG
ncbi:MAG: hypothetical protein WBP61_11560 [Nocardioides sp.]